MISYSQTHLFACRNKDGSFGSGAGEHVAPCPLIAGERMSLMERSVAFPVLLTMYSVLEGFERRT